MFELVELINAQPSTPTVLGPEEVAMKARPVPTLMDPVFPRATTPDTSRVAFGIVWLVTSDNNTFPER